ncbi:PilW family protein [Synoicihabitans lomoniglobus]|uniref:Prepilin-type N-terminal cleavage/methylation domain-containing protein n=1 Tax=Synoicihabitans lomoniglobus TaxID=2909285 RepID=A0AAF0A1D5_9BACT|nr:prepilin-type N-terminal cleavage/methylation domain-containing protein [Opitutaceae bacterium LMO-M01]WED65683.1 prepilin-type N-terminal cleavage/methylation domain-containing protein [Opitutaceae bacterium LMO-M01]
MKRRGGFTLMELMVALALVAMVLIGLNSFIFSMSELWGRGRDWRLFDQHARAVTRFLERELRVASLPPAVASGQASVEVREVEVQFGRREELLTFGLREGSRILEWPERPLPDVWCALEVRRGEGLVLYWQSALEERFDDDPPREMVLTPLVTEIAYDYFDAEFNRWETEDAFRTSDDRELETPSRIRLTFTYRDETIVTVVPLPLFGEGLPPF